MSFEVMIRNNIRLDICPSEVSLLKVTSGRPRLLSNLSFLNDTTARSETRLLLYTHELHYGSIVLRYVISHMDRESIGPAGSVPYL